MPHTDYSSLPNDAKIIYLILQSMGVKACETRVIHQLMEFSYRYITDLLQDALIYADHAGRGDVDVTDVQLAIQSKTCYAFTRPPPRDFLLDVAKERNNKPLPLLDDKFGLRLPDEKHCLTAVNYEIIPQILSQRILSAQAKAAAREAKEMADPQGHHNEQTALDRDVGMTRTDPGGFPSKQVGPSDVDEPAEDEENEDEDEADTVAAINVETWEGKRDEDEDYDF